MLTVSNLWAFIPKWNVFIKLLPSMRREQCGDRKIVRSRGHGWLQRDPPQAQQNYCLYELTDNVIAHVRPVHIQGAKSQHGEGEAGTKSYSLTVKLFAIDSALGKVKLIFSNGLILGISNSRSGFIIPGIIEQCKPDSMAFVCLYVCVCAHVLCVIIVLYFFISLAFILFSF